MLEGPLRRGETANGLNRSRGTCVEVDVATQATINKEEGPMTKTTTSVLRQRMLDDMSLRKLTEQTQRTYIRAVERFTRFFGQSPDLASPEDLRRFQKHLVETGVSTTTINGTITGLRFLFEVTLDRPQALKKMSPLKTPQKLPTILSVDEMQRLLNAAPGLKARAALSVAYGAGLRASEVVHLKLSDIDSERMILRIEQGKGRRDRYAMLAPSLLELLRRWYRDWGVAVSRPEPGKSALHPPAQPLRQDSCRGRRDRQAGVHAHPQTQLRYPSAGTEGRHPPDPGALGPSEAR
jgi:integrase